MPHDFVRFPELRGIDLDIYYFQSPHKQIFEDFTARVVRVHDGDTITVRWKERDFDFPVRLAGTNAPELGEKNGRASQKWLEDKILGADVDIIINPDERVEKWGRLLGTIYHGGFNVNEASILLGHATTFDARDEGKIPLIHEVLPDATL